jgi:hypothetical protein
LCGVPSSIFLHTGDEPETRQREAMSNPRFDHRSERYPVQPAADQRSAGSLKIRRLRL